MAEAVAAVRVEGVNMPPTNPGNDGTLWTIMNAASDYY